MTRKYEAAISDTDILINLAKVNRLDILELLFSKIIVPFYIYDHELRKKAGKYFNIISQEIERDDSIFELRDRKKERTLNILAMPIISDKNTVIGPGESECAGYAEALGIPIIISDNSTEFKWLSEYITLTHNNYLSLCVYFGKISDIEAEAIYNDINKKLTRPSSLSFDQIYSISFKTIKENQWADYLGVIHK